MKTQTDGQNIYRIDAHLWGESAQKNWSDISNRGRENHVSPKLCWQTDKRTYGQTDFCFHRVALLLKSVKVEEHNNTHSRG